MGFADRASARVARATRRALEEIGRRAVQDIRETIDTPVEYVSGPRGGTIVIRSDPDEPPRMEKKKLWRSVKFRIRSRAKTLKDLTVYTRDKKAPWLEFGTDFMEPRPFWNPAKRRFNRYAPSVFKALFREYLQEEEFYDPDPQIDQALPEEDMD